MQARLVCPVNIGWKTRGLIPGVSGLGAALLRMNGYNLELGR